VASRRGSEFALDSHWRPGGAGGGESGRRSGMGGQGRFFALGNAGDLAGGGIKPGAGGDDLGGNVAVRGGNREDDRAAQRVRTPRGTECVGGVWARAGDSHGEFYFVNGLGRDVANGANDVADAQVQGGLCHDSRSAGADAGLLDRENSVREDGEAIRER